nr:hypothetical protein [Tanacetum cinerariifolium]
MKRRPEECYDLIENMTAHYNDWDTSSQRSESSSSITSSSDTKIAELKAEMAEINKNLMRVLQVNQQVKAVTPNCKTYGGPHSFNDCPATVGQTQNVYAAGAYQGASHGQNPPPAYQAPVYQAPVHHPQIPQPQVATTNEFTNFMKVNDAILKNMQTNMTSLTNSNLELKNMFGNTITNPKEEFKGITTRSGTAYQGPTIPTTSSSLPPVVERETEATKDTVHPTNNGSTKDIQPSFVQTEFPILNSEPVVAPIIEPVVAPVSAPKPNQRPLIPYPARLHDQKLRDKANDQRKKFFQIFKDLNFNISFADALILMPKFSPTIKTLLTNKDKLSEIARTLLNKHCSTPCANLGASINLMSLSVWNKLSLPNLSPTCMTLELADRLISRPVGVAKDVFVKVGTFHFSAAFVVIDFDADPRVPLILRRSFLKTRRALIDVFDGELTLRVGKEAITFNLDQTSRYSANYNDMTANRIDVIDMACEEYSLEVLGFSDVIAKVDAFLALEDDPTSPKVDQSYVDTKGDILLLEAFLNDDPSLPLVNQGNYLPEVHKELKICKAKSDKSLIDEPPEVKLKDLPPHLEYAFLQKVCVIKHILANHLTTDGIKDGIFKKNENAKNKKRSNDQIMNRGSDDRNKRQRTGRNFALTAPEQGQGHRQYAGQHPKTINERPRPTCFKCGDPNHFWRNFPRMNRATTSRRNRPNPGLAIKGNTNQGNNRNQARGKAFALDLSSLPPPHEVEIHLDLIPGALPVSKSPYHLAPTEMQELSNQLKELKEKVYGNLRTLIMNEAHATRYFVHPGAEKMYYDLRGLYWWRGMKKDIAIYENITMDFTMKLPRTNSRHDAIWVIVDRLTKSAYFLAIREDYKTERLARLYINEIIARQALGAQLDLSTAYHPRPIAKVSVPFKLRKICLELMQLILAVEVAESKLIRPEIVHDTTDKIVQIKERLKATRDRQKSYVDNRQKSLEFNVGDKVLLKVTPRKGV